MAIWGKSWSWMDIDNAIFKSYQVKVYKSSMV